jgi:hypothetical protein
MGLDYPTSNHNLALAASGRLSKDCSTQHQVCRQMRWSMCVDEPRRIANMLRSVLRDRLLDIALSMPSNEDCFVQKFTRVGGMARYRHAITALPLQDTVPFYPKKCTEAAHATRNEVLVDGVERSVVEANVLLEQQLQEHVKNNLVRIGNKV